jgi:hypothetical protein
VVFDETVHFVEQPGEALHIRLGVLSL